MAGTQPIHSPVEDSTYNLLSTLTEKLESIEVYQKYVEDDPNGETGTLFRELALEDVRQAERIMELLRKRLS